MLFLLTPAWKLLPSRSQLNLVLNSVGAMDFCFIHLERMVLAAGLLDLFLTVQNIFLCSVFQVYSSSRNPESRYVIQTSWVSPKFTEHSRHTIDNGTQTSRWSQTNWLYNHQTKYGWSQKGLGFPWWWADLRPCLHYACTDDNFFFCKLTASKLEEAHMFQWKKDRVLALNNLSKLISALIDLTSNLLTQNLENNPLLYTTSTNPAAL